MERIRTQLILNGYTVLSVFVCLLRFVLGLVVASAGLSVWRQARRKRTTSQSDSLEHRSYRMIVSAGILIGLNVVSWPILYLLLQSYVSEWPSAMCIYGVTQVGAGSLGASRFLPGLLIGLQWMRPFLLFVGGTGFVLYLINRRTQSAPLASRVLLVFLLTGIFSVVDAAVEGAYLLIPKSELRLAGGCCTNRLESVQQDSKFTPTGRVSEQLQPILTATYFTLNVVEIALLLSHLTLGFVQIRRVIRFSSLTIGVSLIPLNLLFFIEVAAPKILGLPFHRCLYDLISVAPESVVGLVLFVLGCFGLGWSYLAEKLGSCEETRSFLQDDVSKLMFIALFGYTGSTLLFSLELCLAG